MRNRFWLFPTTVLATRSLNWFSTIKHNAQSYSNMAWLSSGDSNDDLISNMRKGGLIESDVVAEASLALMR
jgi:hypothetical protein